MPSKRSSESDAVPPQQPQVTPSFHTGADHSFTLQAVMELQKSVGEMNANLEGLRASVDGLKGKVEDLVAWKNKILGGVVVISVVATIVGFAISKFSDYVTVRVPESRTNSPAATGQPASRAAEKP